MPTPEELRRVGGVMVSLLTAIHNHMSTQVLMDELSREELMDVLSCTAGTLYGACREKAIAHDTTTDVVLRAMGMSVQTASEKYPDK
jgi:hypothetical protein